METPTQFAHLDPKFVHRIAGDNLVEWWIYEGGDWVLQLVEHSIIVINE